MSCNQCGAPMTESTICSRCGQIQPAGRMQGTLPGPPGVVAAAPAADQNAVRRLSFHGDGGSLFGILIVNALLTVFTLGIYHFWGKVKVRNFFYSHLDLDGDRFAFHGTGKELLLSWLKVAGCIVALVLVIAGFGAILGKNSPILNVIVFLVYIGVLCIIPYAMVGARRYLLSRSSLRGIRFSFRGNAGDLLKMFLKGSFLTALTLGFYSPYFMNDLHRFFVSNSYYGDRRFSYDGEGRDLMGAYVRAFFLGIVTLGIYWLWYIAERQRYTMAHTSLGGLRFQSNITGGGLFGIALTNGLLVLFTAGLALPWAMCRLVRFHCNVVTLHGPLGVVRQDLQYASATGEELANALDVGAGFGI